MVERKGSDIVELYVIGYFDNDELQRLVRKGRNYNIVGYDNIASAKRGLAQTKSWDKTIDYRILKADGLTEVSI